MPAFKTNKTDKQWIIKYIFRYVVREVSFFMIKPRNGTQAQSTAFSPLASPAKYHVSHIALLEYKWAHYIRRRTTCSRLEDNPLNSTSLLGCNMGCRFKVICTTWCWQEKGQLILTGLEVGVELLTEADLWRIMEHSIIYPQVCCALFCCTFIMCFQLIHVMHFPILFRIALLALGQSYD